MNGKISFLNGDFILLGEQDVLFNGNMDVQKDVSIVVPDWLKVDNIVIAVVHSGWVEGNLNGCKHRIQAREMAMCVPKSWMEHGMKSDDLKMSCISISRTYMEKILPVKFFNYDLILYVSQNPVVELTEEEYRRFVLFYELLDNKGTGPSSSYNESSIEHLLKSFMYDFYNVFIRNMSMEEKSEYSQGRNLFRNFVELLYSVYPKPRSVSYYAERLNVTPKYLSSVCKDVSKKPASVIIHNSVKRDIYELLVHTDKSIKEIMVELEFPSLSFFGKYVKKHFGMGPKEFRTQRLS